MGQGRRGGRVKWRVVLLRALHGRPLLRLWVLVSCVRWVINGERLNIEECVLNESIASYR